MNLEQFLQKLQSFEEGGTSPSWSMDNDVTYNNEYLNVVRIDSSNVSGGANVKRGKQWSIIIDLKKDFEYLRTWQDLVDGLKGNITLTKVTRGKNAGKYGIRLYKMSANPTNEIIFDLLQYIFT